jgi:hypothetical protein
MFGLNIDKMEYQNVVYLNIAIEHKLVYISFTSWLDMLFMF